MDCEVYPPTAVCIWVCIYHQHSLKLALFAFLMLFLQEFQKRLTAGSGPQLWQFDGAFGQCSRWREKSWETTWKKEKHYALFRTWILPYSLLLYTFCTTSPHRQILIQSCVEDPLWVRLGFVSYPSCLSTVHTIQNTTS